VAGLRRILVIAAVVSALLAVDAPSARAQAPPATDNANADWILQSVLPDGAIQIYPDNPPGTIEPYFANYAAMGLARAAVLTKNTRYAMAAWNWLAWYAAHEDAQGFVTDYTVTDGAETSTGSEDSTDGYAGTFLSAVAQADPTDPSRLSSLAAGIQGAVTAILATQDQDGLTWALPTYPVKYLSDNAEAYAGLVAAARLERILGNTREATTATTAAKAMARGIQSLWNPKAGDYNWAKFADTSEQTTNWTVLYPDALEQATVSAWHLAGSHATSLMAAFLAHQPSWSNAATQGYQPLAAIGAEAAGTIKVGENGAQAMDQYATANNHPWPFEVATAGELIFAESNSSLIAG
jgi:hypothetical protein